jgi:hypothetical protein
LCGEPAASRFTLALLAYEEAEGSGDQRLVVGAGGFEPPTSSVSRKAHLSL